MQKLYWIYLVFLLPVGLAAQNFTTADESDPKAKSMLKKVQSKLEYNKSIRTDYNLELHFPSENSHMSEGSIHRKGDQFRANFLGHTFICDGKNVWTFIEEYNEVQITALEGEDEDEINPISPNFIKKLIDGKNHVYVLHGFNPKNGWAEIEFKPLDYADYSKFRISVDTKANLPKQILFFNKDGSKMEINLTKFSFDYNPSQALFKFDKSEFPGAAIEDLRF